MNRTATTVLLLLALFNIAHGDIWRPCQCDGENPYSCGACPADRGGPDQDEAPC